MRTISPHTFNLRFHKVYVVWVTASCMIHAQLDFYTQLDVQPQLAEQMQLLEQTQLWEQTYLIAQSGHPATQQSTTARVR